MKIDTKDKPNFFRSCFSWGESSNYIAKYNGSLQKISHSLLVQIIQKNSELIDLYAPFHLAGIELKTSIANDPYVRRSVSILNELESLEGRDSKDLIRQLHLELIRWKLSDRLTSGSLYPSGSSYEHLELTNGFQLIYGNTKHTLSIETRTIRLDQVKGIAKDINVALDFIRKVDQRCFELVRMFCQVIEVIDNPDHDGFRDHTPSFGLLVMENAHSNQLNLADLLTSLIGNAVHYALFALVEMDPSFPKLPISHPSRRTTSPWTGNSVSYESYISNHLSWYGLANFLSKALLLGTISASERSFCKGLYDKCLLGFHVEKNPRRRLGVYFDALDFVYQNFLNSSRSDLLTLTTEPEGNKR